ncbi:MAG TPA: hypothetical protein VJZ75_03860 [Candidatus Bathyarchaeia archaeon]|nr:hypothetical protein [Candidatus Bathyarchaeia archaeon]
MNSRQTIILALVVSLYVLGIPSQAIALGTPTAYPSTNDSFKVQGASQPQLMKVPLFLHIVNTNSGVSISGALVWFDGFLAGSADSFGVLGISVTRPSSGHTYVVSAGGYQVEKGTITIGANSDGHFTVRLTPNAPRE